MTGPNLLAWAKGIVESKRVLSSYLRQRAAAILADEEERKRKRTAGERLIAAAKEARTMVQSEPPSE